MAETFSIFLNDEQTQKIIALAGTQVKTEILAWIKATILQNPYPKEQNKEQLQLETMRLRNEKLRLEIEMLKNEIAYAQTFDGEPSEAAKKAMMEKAKTRSLDVLQPDGSMKCISCGCKIPTRAFGFQQAEDYQKHVEYTHNRSLYDFERKICLELAEK